MASAPPTRRSPGRPGERGTRRRPVRAWGSSGGDEGHRQAQKQRKAVARRRREADGEDLEESADRRGTAAGPDGRRPRRRSLRRAPRSSAVVLLERGDAGDALLPRADSLDRGRRRRQRASGTGIESRSAAARIAASSKRDALPSGVLMTSWISPASMRSTALGLALVHLVDALGLDAGLPERLARPLRRAEGESEVRRAPVRSGSPLPCRTD